MSIDILDLSSQTHLKRVRIFDNGPNEIINPLAIFPITLDSIFVMNDLSQLFLINEEGKLLKKWNISSKKLNNLDVENSLLFIYSQPDMINYGFAIDAMQQKAYVRLLWNTNFDWSDVLWDEYLLPPIAEIDLKTGDITQVVGKYPFELDDKLPLEFFPPFELAQGKLLLQFQNSSKIYWEDTLICAKSLFSKGEVSRWETNQSLQTEEVLQSYHWNELYTDIIYDPYRNLIYRVFQHAQEERDGEGLYKQKLEAPFSIMVLDMSGKVLREAVFPPKKYDFLNISVVKEGLLLCKENPFNNQNKEEVYEFDIIQI